jgi:hypothetical protein
MDGMAEKGRMTLQEAILDKNRPLSVTPQEWILYEEAKEHEEEEIFDDAPPVREALHEQSDGQDEEAGGDLPPEERFEVGMEQMVLGCRIAIRALQELSRSDLRSDDRGYYSECERLVYHAVAPYLADILVKRRKHFSRRFGEMNNPGDRKASGKR